MRKVKVLEYEKDLESGEFELVEKGEGLLHAFGVDYQELENGSGTYSTAIVEMEGGRVKNVPVELIQFCHPEHKRLNNL